MHNDIKKQTCKPCKKHSLKMSKLGGYRQRGLSLIEMAVVIMVIAMLMSMSLSILSNFKSLMTTSEGAAKKLASALQLARKTAVKSGQTVYFEFDLDEESYRAYRLNRNATETSAKVFLGPVKLSNSYSLQAVASVMGNRNTKDKIKVSFSPNGIGEEIAIYLGEDGGEVEATVIYSRYSGKATVYTEEIEHDLSDPSWEELDIYQ